MDDQKFADFLNKKFMEYMNRKGRRADITEFSKWIGVAQPSMSQWMRAVGRQPNLENLVKMAVRLGVEETFEAAGMTDFYQALLAAAFKDADFAEVARAWFELPEAERERIMTIARGEADDPCPETDNTPEGVAA